MTKITEDQELVEIIRLGLRVRRDYHFQASDGTSKTIGEFTSADRLIDETGKEVAFVGP